ncbi:MAG: hypothetical protein NW237_11465 [Cyanobacteriota bacterium]|nr:hypothetical protein [Cyanobacteriota bacterium]
MTHTQTHSQAQVSSDLQAQLDRLSQQHQRDCKAEIAEQLSEVSQLIDYDVCLWWDGCYYCRNEVGVWEQVRCFL